MNRADGDVHVIDISEVVRDPQERAGLIAWGAAYLSSSDEDATVRAASLALELRDRFFIRARQRGMRLSFWQARLQALALTTACVRYRAAQQEEEAVHAVRH